MNILFNNLIKKNIEICFKGFLVSQILQEPNYELYVGTYLYFVENVKMVIRTKYLYRGHQMAVAVY